MQVLKCIWKSYFGVLGVLKDEDYLYPNVEGRASMLTVRSLQLLYLTAVKYDVFLRIFLKPWKLNEVDTDEQKSQLTKREYNY